jgi:hypothetical protein
MFIVISRNRFYDESQSDRGLAIKVETQQALKNLNTKKVIAQTRGLISRPETAINTLNSPGSGSLHSAENNLF